jgi:PGF-CTERM protein
MKGKNGVILVLVVLLLMPISVYAEACPQCGGTGVITEICPQCGGRGTISREIRYQVIDVSVREYGILDWKADVDVAIRNLDDKTGYFRVTATATGGGKTLTNTVGAYIDPGAVEEVAVTLDITFDGKYAYDYNVKPERIEITCPKCGGTGKITTTCPECSGTGEVTPGFEVVFAIAGLLAVVYLLRRRK